MLRLLRCSLVACALLSVCAGAQAQLFGARSSSPLASLARGTRTVLLTGIPTAENLHFLSDGRLLVSGDEGIYLITQSGTGAFGAQNLFPSPPCAFGAIAEARGTVYVNCYDFSRAFVYAAPLETLAFERVVEVASTSMANGLSSDGDHLYLSSTLQGKVVRLTIDPGNPRRLTQQTEFGGARGALTPNGVEVFGDTLYYTSLMAVKAAPLSGGAPRTLATRLTFFDDLHVDERGIIACDFLGNVLVAYDPAGKQVAQTRAEFKGPSAVVPARGRLGLGPNDLIVTERAGGVVSVYRPE